MVERVLKMMHKEIRGLHQAAYILALFTFGSQLLALVRDRLLAGHFGASIELDLYYTAFRIPDILYVLFASTLSVYVLIPFITERTQDGSSEKAKALLSQIFSLFILLYIVIAGVAMIFAPSIVAYLFPGFVAQSDTLVLLIRILLLQPLLLGVSSLYGVITQMEHRFILYAIGPLLYNLGIIFGLVALYPYMGVAGLAIGVVVGALGHLCIQLPYVLKAPLSPRFLLTFDFAEIGRVCRVSLTRALTLSLHQIVLLVLVGFASVMSVGSVSVFQFAFNLQSVPLAIIGISYSVAAFPSLAKLYAEKQYEAFGGYILNALRHIIFWSLPTIVLFIVIRAQFVRVVLGSGSFDWNDTRLTAAALALFILSLTAQTIHLLMVRALYAVGNTRIPFYVTLMSSTLALVGTWYLHTLFSAHAGVSLFVEQVMRLEGVTGTEVLALPLGYTIALIVHSIVILFVARKHVYISLRCLVMPLLQGLLASLLAGLVAYISLNYFVTIFTTDTLFTILLQGALAAFLGLATFVLIQHLVKNSELAEVLRMCSKRFVRKDTVVAPQDEDHLAV
jgi:putative peptidoglycan lipid II flippase